jgi:hypothetical protein
MNSISMRRIYWDVLNTNVIWLFNINKIVIMFLYYKLSRPFNYCYTLSYKFCNYVDRLAYKFGTISSLYTSLQLPVIPSIMTLY